MISLLQKPSIYHIFWKVINPKFHYKQQNSQKKLIKNYQQPNINTTLKNITGYTTEKQLKIFFV